jgi:FlaA1/EpsC-like NDP-sugar epimerase
MLKIVVSDPMEEQLNNIFKNKKILVTGGTGCIGSEIVKSLLNYNPKVVRILSNDENSIFQMSQEIGSGGTKRFLIGDIRDKERLRVAMDDIDIVYHAAALKHVPLCEYNPFEAIKTNVLGTQNIIQSAIENKVNKVIAISTDKAVNPINTMGATKLLSEKLIIDANFYKGPSETIFSCLRFGNVIFSRGSVVPLFEEQIKSKKMITLTDPNMTRFMMSIDSTLELVFKSTLMAKGGEIFILKMPVVKLGDLTDVAIEKFAKKYGYKKSEIKKEIIGPRPGEKIFEELMTGNEAKIAFETEDMLIIPPPANIGINLNIKMSDYKGASICKLKRYISRDVKPLSKDDIKKILINSDDN